MVPLNELTDDPPPIEIVVVLRRAWKIKMPWYGPHVGGLKSTVVPPRPVWSLPWTVAFPVDVQPTGAFFPQPLNSITASPVMVDGCPVLPFFWKVNPFSRM